MTAIATATLIIDTRREKAGGKFPIKLRIIYNRKPKYYSVVVDNKLVDLSKEEWGEVTGAKPKKEWKSLRQKLAAVEEKADNILKSLPSFTFAEFEKAYKSPPLDEKDVYKAFLRYIDKLNKEDRVTTAFSYNNALQSLSKFKKTLLFDEVTPEFLRKYEKWMLDQEKAVATIGIYLRSLKAIINEAMEAGLFPADRYPFGRRRFVVPIGKNTKKALSIDQIEKVYNYPVEEGTNQHLAKDIWLFTYLCNGINLKDICLLKGKDIAKGKLTYYRAKTKRTTRKDPKPIIVMLSDEAQAIIQKWGNKQVKPNDYIFPFLNGCPDAVRERQLINQLTKTINKYNKRMGEELKLEIKLITYAARHSFSTVLKKSGYSKEFIQESLGHADSKTTENYLDSFEDEVKEEMSKSLLAFNKQK